MTAEQKDDAKAMAALVIILVLGVFILSACAPKAIQKPQDVAEQVAEIKKGCMTSCGVSMSDGRYELVNCSCVDLEGK